MIPSRKRKFSPDRVALPDPAPATKVETVDTSNHLHIPELEYFNEDLYQHAILRSFKREFQPISALATGAPIDFVVPAAPHLYILPNRSYLRVRVVIENPATNRAILETDLVAPCNLTFDSLFSDLIVELGGKVLNSNGNGLYAYRAYIETLFGLNDISEFSILQASGWYRDIASEINNHIPSVHVTEPRNRVLVNRRQLFAAGRQCDLFGRPHHDLFHAPIALPSNIGLKLRLLPSASSFVLQTPAPDADHPQVPFRMAIKEAVLVMHTWEIAPAVEEAHIQMLAIRNIRFPLKQMEMRMLTIPPGHTSCNFERVFNGAIPERIVLFLVSQQAIDGHYQENPFNLHHHNLNLLCVYLNGISILEEPLRPDFRHNGRDVVKCFIGLNEAIYSLFKNKAVPISLHEFSNGFTIFAFDLTLDGSAGCIPSPTREGGLRIQLGFAEAPTHTLSLIVLGDRRVFCEIDRFGQVIVI